MVLLPWFDKCCNGVLNVHSRTLTVSLLLLLLHALLSHLFNSVQDLNAFLSGTLLFHFYQVQFYEIIFVTRASLNSSRTKNMRRKITWVCIYLCSGCNSPVHYESTKYSIFFGLDDRFQASTTWWTRYVTAANVHFFYHVEQLSAALNISIN